jgi:Uma2 family endonuclease
MYMASRTARHPKSFRWTSARLAMLPRDGNRYEALDGALLVTPQAEAWHNEVALRLAITLREYSRVHGIGTVSVPASVLWCKNELQPDLMVTPAHIGPRVKWKHLPRPHLVAEVLSPGSERYDRFAKRDAYLRLGIAEYWIVDLDARAVEVHRPRAAVPIVATESLVWAPREGIAPLEIDVRKLFAE